jgi:phosphatidate cytidylyltransferase
MSELKQRCVVSFISVILLVLIIFLSSYVFFRPIFSMIVAGIATIGLWEYFQLVKAKGFKPLEKIGMLLGVAIVAAFFLSTQFMVLSELPLITLMAAMLIVLLCCFWKSEGCLVNSAITLFGLIYVVASLSLLIKVRYFPFPEGVKVGSWWIIYLLVVTKMSDVGAFFVGKRFGRHKLAPKLSPGKTVEGFFGGVFASLFASFAMVLLGMACCTHSYVINWWQALWLGLAVSIFGQIGDLVESSMKRDAGVKDSNNLPGLGGILDIVDSLLFTIPLVYIFMGTML